jgi:hypothetical protein
LFSFTGQHFSQGASSPVIGQVDDCSCDAGLLQDKAKRQGQALGIEYVASTSLQAQGRTIG